MTNYSSPAARILRATTERMPIVPPVPMDTAATCFVCGAGEHAPTELHAFWSIADAMAEAEAHDARMSAPDAAAAYVAEHRPY